MKSRSPLYKVKKYTYESFTWRDFNIFLYKFLFDLRRSRFNLIYKIKNKNNDKIFNIFMMKLSKKKILLLPKLKGHYFHIVTPSPWPLLTSIVTFTFLIGVVSYIHRYENGGLTLSLGLISLLICMGIWWRDVIRESTWQGNHTFIVRRGLKIGFFLFLVSEIMFFFSIFWAFFHSSLSPSVEIGSVWPPIGLPILNPWEIPFLNTAILIMSGITITLAHHCIIARTKLANIGFLSTVFLAIFFTSLQIYEYIFAPFEFSDGIYGSTFFFSTGFHGMHVLIGTIFIIVCWIRFNLKHFNKKHHLGFEFAAWYWHFVDIVWLLLFASVYWWGSLT
jgi:cytochrome c oxidase subunit 3